MFRTHSIASVESLEGRRLLAAGDLDPTFDRGGVVLRDPAALRGGAAAVVVQSDGKLVSGGTFEPERQGGPVHFALLRYNADGSTDRSFGVDGFVTANPPGASASYVTDVAVQGDGRIVAAGWAHVGGDDRIAVARFNRDGSLDTSFNGSGFRTVDFGEGNERGHSLALDPRNGRIVVAGIADAFSAVEDMAFVRLNTNGTLDTTFDGDGRRRLDILDRRQDGAEAVLVRGDGRIVAAGWHTSGAGDLDMAAVRLNTNGSLDTSWDGDGKEVVDFAGDDDQAFALAFGPGGTVIAAGTASVSYADLVHPSLRHEESAFALARFTAAGSLDTTFGGGDGMEATIDGDTDSEDQWHGVAVLPDGKIVAAGLNKQDEAFGNWVIGRYHADGRPDTGFARQGLLNLPGEIQGIPAGASDVAVQSGKPVVVGPWVPDDFAANPYFGAVRINPDGTVDKTFGRGGITAGRAEDFAGDIIDLAWQADGKILAAGQFHALSQETPRHHLLRYNADGTPDLTFGDKGAADVFPDDPFTPGREFERDIVGVEVVSGGKILVGGNVIRPDVPFNVGGDFYAIRLNPDGSVDRTFGDGGFVMIDFGGFNVAEYLAVAPDGSFALIGTPFGTGGSVVQIARFTASGEPQPGFGVAGKATHPTPRQWNASGFSFDSAGRLVAAFNESGSGQAPRQFLLRYTTSGERDATYGTGGVAAVVGREPIVDLLLDPTDRALVAVGDFFGPGNLIVKRFTAAGAPDAGFGDNGTATVPVTEGGSPLPVTASSLALQPDGRVIVAGPTLPQEKPGPAGARVVVARLTSAGRPDPTFAGDGTATPGIGILPWEETAVGDVLVDGQGRIVIGGRVSGTPLLARYQGGAGAPALPGDLNLDGSVNGSDFSILATNFGKVGMTYHDGDINGDGRVDGADFSILAGNFGKMAPR